MRRTPWLLLGAFAVLSIAHATEPIGGWQRLPKALYFIHGGSLADRQTGLQACGAYSGNPLPACEMPFGL